MKEPAEKTAYVRYTGDQITVTSPYDADFVAELKSGLTSRRWNPEKKIWTVDVKERQNLIEIASRYYRVVEENQPDGIAVEPIESSTGDIASVLKPGAELEIWTDGACFVNPGPGGYGMVFKCNGQRWEKAGGFQLTTNNRMEIMGALIALETLPEKCKVVLYSDSQYLVNSVMKGWVKRWRSKGWNRKQGKKVPNSDLWERMLQLCVRHQVEFRWIRGHDANVENERCDRLAESAARKPDLPIDTGYTGAEDDSL